MSTTLPGLPPWPLGKPLPPGGITILYDPATNLEYRIDLTRLGSDAAEDASYHKGTYKAGADGAQTLTSVELPSLGTAVAILSVGVRGVDGQGNPILEYLPSDTYSFDAGTLRVQANADIDKDDVLEIAWLTPGDLTAAGIRTASELNNLLEAGDGILITPTPKGKLRISCTVPATGTQRTVAAPTNGAVDDIGDTFSFLPNPAFPSFAQYKVNGLPGVTGAVVLDNTNSYVQGSRVYVKVVGPVAKSGLAVYVAGSGSVPDGAVLTNDEAFTGAIVSPTPTPGVTLTAALAISAASIMAGSALTFEVTAGGGTAPYSYAVKATNNATGAVTVLGSSATGSFTPQTGGTTYNIDATVTDSAGKVVPAATRTVTVTAPQSVNQLPVANAGEDLTITQPTSSVALMGMASDPDAGDSLTYLWRPISGPNTPTGLPATTLNVVVSGLIVGTYQFGFQATDQKGGKSTEDFVVVTVKAAPTTPGTGGRYASEDYFLENYNAY
jgi:hypothetical protein